MFKKILGSVSSGADRVKEVAAKATDGGFSALNAAKSFTADTATAATDRVSAIMEAHWSTVERIIVDGLLTIASDRLSDDQLVRGVMEKVYETFPVALRLVVPRDRYLEFAISRREPILLRLDEYRSRRALGSETPKLLADGLEASPSASTD